MRRERRRQIIVAAGGIGILAALPVRPRESEPSTARPSIQAAIHGVIGDAPLHKGRVHIDLPPLVENGNGVPFSVSVDSPMTVSDHVRVIHVLNEKNPLPEIATFRLGPRAGRARITTRIRLSDTQSIVAIAQMNDGTYWAGEASIVVTLAACLEEL